MIHGSLRIKYDFGLRERLDRPFQPITSADLRNPDPRLVCAKAGEHTGTSAAARYALSQCENKQQRSATISLLASGVDSADERVGAVINDRLDPEKVVQD